MRIISGTDFSIHANAAATAAGTLAARLELPLTLVHVIDPNRYSNPTVEFVGYLRRDRQNKLQKLAERAGRTGAIVETAVLEGAPAEKLAEVAAQSRARALVISAIGQVAPTEWLTGSVTDQAVQTSPVPAIVLRDPASFECWLHGKRPLKVLVGYDFSASAEAAIRWVGALNSVAPCEIVVAYVASAVNERSRLGIAPPLSPVYYPSALRKFLQEEIQQKSGSILGGNARISVQADWGRADGQLLEMAAESGVDLTVVGRSRRRGIERLGSVARAVVHYAKTNVASVPEGWVVPEMNESEPNEPAETINAADALADACKV